jgi:hypothetical protein
MGATCADHGKVAVLGAGRGDWLCIGTSLDAQGSRGRVTAPGPDSSEPGSRALRGSQWGMAGVSTGRFILGLLGREELVQPGHQQSGWSRRSGNQSGYQSVWQSWQNRVAQAR